MEDPLTQEAPEHIAARQEAKDRRSLEGWRSFVSSSQIVTVALESSFRRSIENPLVSQYPRRGDYETKLQLHVD